jgi:hypothetical protein
VSSRAWFVTVLACLCPTHFAALAETAGRSITLWHPTGQITAGAAHFSAKELFAECESRTNVRMDMGAVYDAAW